MGNVADGFFQICFELGDGFSGGSCEDDAEMGAGFNELGGGKGFACAGASCDEREGMSDGVLHGLVLGSV